MTEWFEDESLWRALYPFWLSDERLRAGEVPRAAR
jgi:hypothetical protein